MVRPTARTVLAVLTRTRLYDLAADAGLDLPKNLAKAELVDVVAAAPVGLEVLLGGLKRDELKGMCRTHGLDDSGREKAPILARILAATQDELPADPPPPAAPARPAPPAPQLRLDVVTPPTPTGAPTARSVLETLAPDRLIEIGRLFGVPVDLKTPRLRVLDLLVTATRTSVTDILGALTRDELRAACRLHGLDHAERSRDVLVARLLQAAGESPAPTAAPADTRGLPRPGDIVRCRKRSYLVEDVDPPAERREATLIKLVCLDDDAPGRPLTVLWELELGAQVIRPEAGQLGGLKHLDDPRHFAAYFHAVRWSGVTAADASLFQSPFRAGIKLATYQLTPLMKALELPRANLFIADDVGLGKTIEAGLVLQELLLRQRVEYALVVCPPSVCLQWQDEMSRRFGLHFEVYDREFVARRRRQRGFSVNPWATHNRFIISYPLLRRPEHLEPLVQHLDARGRRKTLLILDEAHTVAPSSPATNSRYSVDSKITGVVRDRVAPSFENRLFLSATPHNGHSNSFSALLEILDPQRFTRGVPVRGVEQLRPVMVRRLKRDIRALIDHESTKLPDRQIVELALTRRDDRWTLHDGAATSTLGATPALELELSTLLQRYTAALGPTTKLQRLVFINLQKRLLSSIPAFARTLRRHAGAFEGTFAPALAAAAAQTALDLSDESLDPDDDVQADAEDAEVEAGTRALPPPAESARDLLQQLLARAEAGRGLPDARVLALVAWIREHMCPAAGFDAVPASTCRTWADRRILVFTESIDTKRYLKQMLEAAFRATDRGDERILELHGAMPEDRREDVQRAFNGPYDEHPVRILLATDAAREGVNLQGRCADLFHFDIPWNPARMEQRNGRIDRTGQDEPVVRCHYFRYTDRAEDIVLATLVRKVGTIERELGSLGALLQGRLAELLDAEGITQSTLHKLEAASQPGDRAEAVQVELEQLRTADIKQIKREIDRASKVLGQSRGVLDFTTDLLRDTVDVALQRLGHGPLTPAKAEDGVPAWTLPPLPDTWAETLDSLRPPRARDEPLWDWRRRPPQPVVFDPPGSMRSPRVHLHLHHPLVRRLLDGFLAHGFGAHDLQRVTVVRDKKAGQPRVLAFGRLSLFGRGAARLHDTLVPVVALWDAETGPQLGAEPVEDLRALDRLEQLFGEPTSLKPIAKARQQDILRRTTADFAALWPAVRAEADARAHDVERKLRARGQTEADQLRKLLEDQRTAIDRTLYAQLDLAGFRDDERDQLEQDRQHMRTRLDAIRRELEREPADLQSLYEIKLRRIEPVGLVYLWPEAMA